MEPIRTQRGNRQDHVRPHPRWKLYLLQGEHSLAPEDHGYKIYLLLHTMLVTAIGNRYRSAMLPVNFEPQASQARARTLHPSMRSSIGTSIR
jgi:hypothetical protein